MNLAEIVLSLHINSLKPMRRVAGHHKMSLSQLVCVCAIPVVGIKQADLAVRLCLDISTLSRNIDRLIKKQLVSKRTSRMDKRSFVISLSPKGEIARLDIFSSMKEYFKGLENRLPLNDQERLVGLLSGLGWTLEKLHSPNG